MESREDGFSRMQHDLEMLIISIDENRVHMQASLDKSKKLNAAIESSKSVGTMTKSALKLGLVGEP